MPDTQLKLADDWFAELGWKPFRFQREAWSAYLNGADGLVNAPTGSGKTYSLIVPMLLESFSTYPNTRAVRAAGLQAIWITPIRALSREIELAAMRAIEGLKAGWKVGVRSGDTKFKERMRQKTSPPQLLITTPESLHLLLAQKGYASFFENVKVVVADEWHELMGSKRGVQVELALSRLKAIAPSLKVWGISATIGNMDEAVQALLGDRYARNAFRVIRAEVQKEVEVHAILPETVEKMPWAGHLGIQLLEKVVKVIQASGSTLLFTNTRSFAEIWYQKILAVAPELSGQVAMHHGSISQDLRNWVENELHAGNLKAVVCTSSLDLGVDFRPVETVIQIGSPKGVARFLQRAGRSGHQPGALSRIFFVPTHSLELVEVAALREAIKRNIVEDRLPYVRSFDVLIQYMLTLAVSDGFRPDELFREVTGTFSYSSVTEDEWMWLLHFITTGGNSLTAYDEYRKVVVIDGVYRVENRTIAMRHRLSVGTIVGDSSLHVRFLTGKYLGTIEESFIARLNPGDVFWFAGRNLELVRIREMEVHVRKTARKSGAVPSWMGGRMPLSSQLSEMIRVKIDEAARGRGDGVEIQFLAPLFQLQKIRSIVPSAEEFLIESFQTDEGYHVVMYPFEGRFVHEGIAAVVAYRIAQIQPITFSIAMNDYGFELLSDQPIPIEDAVETNVLGVENLSHDIQASINSTEMARRKFRDIAAISGLVFKGYPGKPIKDRHLQSSSQLFFNVFNEYEPHNLLLRQAYEEVMDFQLEEARLRRSLERIALQKIVITYPEKPTPFAFPIIVDHLREKLTTEKLGDRIRRMAIQYSD